MAFSEPIAGENVVFSGGWREGYRNQGTAINLDGAKPSGGSVHSQGWEIEEGSDLILNLKGVSVVLPRWDWAVCAINAVLPRTPPLLQTIPAHINTTTLIHQNALSVSTKRLS